MKKGKDSFYCKYIKRILDIICASAAIILFCWLYAIVAFLVRLKLGTPVIFKQARPGKDEKIFYLYKFRTMTDEHDENGNLLPDSIRLTKFGKLLRSTSLDELPEAINILKGDMSIIGPRPLIVNYLPYYYSKERHRHDVLPGMTGLAQVSGRNYLSWEEKFAFDLEYVENVSFKMDIKLLLSTISKVLSREDIEEADMVETDENGIRWCICNGKKQRIYEPLDVERRMKEYIAQ